MFHVAVEVVAGAAACLISYLRSLNQVSRVKGKHMGTLSQGTLA